MAAGRFHQLTRIRNGSGIPGHCLDMNYHGRLCFAGICHPNPGPMGAAFILDGSEHIEKSLSFAFDGSSIVAPYLGLIAALGRAKAEGITKLEVAGNGEVVVKQVAGSYLVKEAHLIWFRDQIKALRPAFEFVDIRWIPYHENLPANDLAKQGMQRSRDTNRIPLANWVAAQRGASPQEQATLF